MNIILSTAFRGIGRPDVSSKAEAVGFVATAVALAVLLPPFGVYGAALASLFAYACVHAFLLVTSLTTFNTSLAALCIPRREDLHALRRAVVDARSALIRHETRSRVRAQEL
jgi:hypothetical protein